MLKFLPNKKKQTSYISVDIGNKNIKLVYGKVNENKIQLMQYGIVGTPQGSISDGKIINVENLANEIQKIIISNNIKEKKIIFTISGSGIITRDVQLPKSTDNEFKKILEFEAEQYFPINLSNYIVDFKVLEEFVTEEGVFNRLLLAAVPKKQTEDFVKLSELLQMEIEAIDLPADCVLKFLYGNKYLNTDVDKQNELPNEFAVLDIGHDSTLVCIFYDKKLMFNRSILIGSSDIDIQLSNELNVNEKEAERYKIFKASLESDTRKWEEDIEGYKIDEIAKSSVDMLIEDLGRFFEFYNSRSSRNTIEKIFICGGGSKLSGFDNYLSSYFQVPVEPLVFSIYDIEYIGSKSMEELNRDFVFLTNAIGALVRD